MSYKQRLVPRVHTSSPLRHLAGALLLIISPQVCIWGGLNKYQPQSMAVMAVMISLSVKVSQDLFPKLNGNLTAHSSTCVTTYIHLHISVCMRTLKAYSRYTHTSLLPVEVNMIYPSGNR